MSSVLISYAAAFFVRYDKHISLHLIHSFKFGINSEMIRIIPEKERLVHNANVFEQPSELHVRVSCLAIDGANKFWIICAVNKGMQPYYKSHFGSFLSVLNAKHWKC
jgi:hypothetical protein